MAIEFLVDNKQKVIESGGTKPHRLAIHCSDPRKEKAMLQAPDVAREVEEVFGSVLGIVRRLHEMGRELVAQGQAPAMEGDYLKRLALCFLARGTTTVLAIENLFSGGLETDAFAIVRTLGEMLIDMNWIWEKDTDERARLFIDHGMVLNLKGVTVWPRIFGQSGAEEMDADRLAQFQEILPPDIRTLDDFRGWRRKELETLRQRYPDLNTWASHVDVASGQRKRVSIRQRAEQTRLLDVYDLVFCMGSESSHSGAGAMRSTIDDDGVITSDPQLPRSAEPLVYAACCYLPIADFAARILGLSRGKIETHRVDLHRTVEAFKAQRRR